MGCKARKGARAGVLKFFPSILLRGSSPRHPTSVRIVEERIPDTLGSSTAYAAAPEVRPSAGNYEICIVFIVGLGHRSDGA